MTAQLIDAMVSLATLMAEESEKLTRSPYLPELGEIAGAKLRLAGRLEAEVARMKRERPDGWLDAVDQETRDQLADASRTLRDASAVNAEILSRQIELSADMMAAIAAEAQRLTGNRSISYGACGGIAGTDTSAPISINTRL
jgi:flagellar biosynthesis/type III secretory pathway chaperone